MLVVWGTKTKMNDAFKFNRNYAISHLIWILLKLDRNVIKRLYSFVHLSFSVYATDKLCLIFTKLNQNALDHQNLAKFTRMSLTDLRLKIGNTRKISNPETKDARQGNKFGWRRCLIDDTSCWKNNFVLNLFHTG